MSLLDCIARIPSSLEKIVNNYDLLSEKLTAYIENKQIEEIIFVASGSSMNASKCTRYFAETICGLKTQYYFPNEFVNYKGYINQNALYIFVSQGGSTKLVYDALMRVQSAGLLNCSITEKLDSPIAKCASLALEMGSVDEEYLYRTLGYSSTVTTSLLVELCIGNINGFVKDKKAELDDLRLAIAHLDEVRYITEKWYKRNKFSLMRRTKAILAGAECFYETSNEADIKLMEMVPMFTRSFELEELIHGPQNAFDDATLYFILSDIRKDKDKVLDIAKFIKKEIGFCAIVGNQKIDEKDLYFELKSNNFTMLEEITAFQVLAYYLAVDHGRDLKRGVNSSMNRYIKKTL